MPDGGPQQRVVLDALRTTAYSDLVIKRADKRADGTRILEGIATTPSPDRTGDIVDPTGAQFKLPMPLLAGHSSREPIGRVTKATVSAEGIRIEAEVPDIPGLDYLRIARLQLEHDLLRCLSIGFVPVEYDWILDAKGMPTGGLHFKKWEWLELSAVVIPAQSEARIETVKAFIRKSAPPASGHVVRLTIDGPNPGASAKKPPKEKAMNLAERIEAAQAKIVGFKDQLVSVSKQYEERDPTEEEVVMSEELSGQIESATQALSMLQRTEAALATKASPVVASSRVPQPPQAKSGIVVSRHRNEKADILIKSAATFMLAHANRMSIDAVLASRYKGDDELAMIVKAAVNPADTVTPGWAAELVGQQIADFIDVLVPVSVYGALASMSLRVTFDRGGIIKVPARNKTPNLAGVFVGEGMPIPVKKGSLASVSLLPHKAAVISTFTRELAQLSNPNIETVIRESVVEDTAVQIDTVLLDNVAGNAIRPAGLLFGVTTIPSSGTTPEDITTDIRALLQALTTAGGGRHLVFLINPVRVVGLVTAMNAAGQFVFRDEVSQGRLFKADVIESTDVPADTIILIDVADFVTATGDAPEWDVSDVATIHEEDTTPLAINGGTPATPVRSLWQTASIGIRMILPLTWAMRRPGMISAITGAAW